MTENVNRRMQDKIFSERGFAQFDREDADCGMKNGKSQVMEN